MLKNAFSRVLVAVFVVLSIVSQGTLVLAGTTGTLTGTVIDSATKQPLVGAKLTATSPSQIATATTDSKGHFELLDIAPDTYTLTVTYTGYDASSLPGVSVFADNTRDIVIDAQKTQKTIAIVKSKPASSLVKAGTTSDVYSVDSTTQAKVAVAGGGSNLDSAFSALATVPGVVVEPGQSGYIGAGPSLSIRGGDYDQIGYEIDGIPVNRAFDNYPSGPTSSLGQQELQAYTGAPPADSQSDGISGYINQVIKTGTLPGFESVTAAIGGPAYYHKIAVEIGGASADRRFSYYAGIGGYNQQYRYANQTDGANYDNSYGAPVGFCTGIDPNTGRPVENYSPSVAPSCYTANGTPYLGGASAANYGPLALGAYDLDATSQVMDRDNVVNLHYYFPHKDGTRDDLQALYQVNLINTSYYTSTNDQGGAAQVAAISGGSPFYIDGLQLNLPTGGFLPANASNLVSNYYFPNTPTHSFDATIDPNLEDGMTNQQAITKVQFTKSLGSNAFARVYGYTYYSTFNETGPDTAYSFDLGVSGDYELSSHTRGISGAITDQINSQNLLNFTGDFTTASVLRSNNTEYDDGLYGPSDVNARTAAAVLVNSANPTNGICYTTSGVATNCFSSGTGLNSGAGYVTLAQLQAGTYTPASSVGMCGTGACQYLIIGNGQYATYNTVKPNFYGASLTDEFRPNSKLTINAGIRLDDYQYVGGDTSGGNARAFEYAAYNNEECISNTTQLVAQKLTIGDTSVSQPCPTGYSAANFTNPSGNVTETYPVFQPRLGATYSLDPNTVLRASYGRFAEPPNSAYEQYNTLQSEAPATLYGTYGFQQYGFTTPNHNIPPATSNNYDFSVEHQFPGQVSIKFTPFYRDTANQIENFFLNRATSFVSGLNVGNQTSKGFEFELDKGNFSQEGLSAKLSFAYTNSTIKYNTLSNGTTVLSPVVDAINAYNALTKKGGGSPCYTLAVNGNPGTADPTCAAGDVANPYYNAPEQSVAAYSPGATSIPYDTIPAGIGLDASQIGAPYVTSLVLNEKIKKFAIAPVLQYFAGERYGDPLATSGIDPTSCSGTIAGSTSSDPRYTYGAAGGSPYDAQLCGQLSGGIPNVGTGAFDGIGAFVEPSQILLSAQLSYEATKNFTLTANVANIANTCFGGTKNVPWAVSGACGYTVAGYGLQGAVGNVYNPGQVTQPSLKNAYNPYFSQQPFNIFVSGNFKI
jgi:hypothetical protein